MIPGLIGHRRQALGCGIRRVLAQRVLELGKECLAAFGNAHPARKFVDLRIAHAYNWFAGGEVFTQLERIGILDLSIESIGDDCHIERSGPSR